MLQKCNKPSLFHFPLPCYNRLCSFFKRLMTLIQRSIRFLPLIICTVFFSTLFIFEGALYLAEISANKRELDRFQAVEHPRRLTSDLYLDTLG